MLSSQEGTINGSLARRRRLHADRDLVDCPRPSRRLCHTRALSENRLGRVRGQRYNGGRWDRGRRRFNNQQEEYVSDYDYGRVDRRRGHWGLH